MRRSGSPARSANSVSLDGERIGRPAETEASFEFFDAGHILGSVGILFRAEGKRVF